MRSERFRQAARRAQRGFGGFALLMLVAGLAATAGMFTFYRHDTAKSANEQATAEALSTAKAALLSWSLQRGAETGVERPGEFPCPDTNDDGFADAPCTGTGPLFGRLPWKTLQIPEPKDGAGEGLWYALSPAFRDVASNPATPPYGAQVATAERINSDTRGTITIRSSDGSTLTSAAVAVVFAPGPAIGNQQRKMTGNLLCTLTNVLGSIRLCPSHYLEAGTGIVSAASLAGPFTTGVRSDTVNDRLVYIDTNELIPLLEERLGRELKNLLTEYRKNSACACYPWADTWEYSGGIADIGQNRGRFPSEPFPEAWGSGTIPKLPEWISDNDWHNLVWYSVARQASNHSVETCRSCSASGVLTVDGVRTAALIITPGPPPDGLARLTSNSRQDVITLYFEDSQNNDSANSNCYDTGEIGGDAGGAIPQSSTSCDQYVNPLSKLRTRDRLYPLGQVPSDATCQAYGQMLADNAPCGRAWTVEKPECKVAMTFVDACSATCANAARTLAKPPCTNNVNPGQCETARNTVRACQATP